MGTSSWRWIINFSAFRDKQQSKPTLRDLQSKSGSSVTPNPIPTFAAEHPAPLNSQPSLGATLLDMPPTDTETPSAEVTLTDVFVPLESIKPSKWTWRLYASAHLEVQIYDMLSSSLSIFLSFPSPGSLLPVTVFDGHSLRVLFHFARDSPPSRPDVLVVIISMLSSAPVPVTNINFQTMAPKVSSEKVQGLRLPCSWLHHSR